MGFDLWRKDTKKKKNYIKARTPNILENLCKYFFFIELLKIKVHHKMSDGYYIFLNISFWFFWKTEHFKAVWRNFFLLCWEKIIFLKECCLNIAIFQIYLQTIFKYLCSEKHWLLGLNTLTMYCHIQTGHGRKKSCLAMANRTRQNPREQVSRTRVDLSSLKSTDCNSLLKIVLSSSLAI